MPYLFDFGYHNPTQIVFGPSSFAKLGSLVLADAKVLLLYGGGSIKRNGVYDKVLAALAGREVVEFSGVEPNPTLETLSAAVEIAKTQGIDFVLGHQECHCGLRSRRGNQPGRARHGLGVQPATHRKRRQFDRL